MIWPPLPESGFVRERIATLEDIAQGQAAFVLGQNAIPIPISIPQYAWHVDTTTIEKSPVIIIQAETNGNLQVVGYFTVGEKSLGIATLAEFELLGTIR